MTAINFTEKIQSEQIMDDLSDKAENKVDAGEMDLNKLAELKARLAPAKPKDENKPMKKERSINFGIVGSGQAGARLAELAWKMGYDCVVLNTASQDLKFIEVPESNKLLLEYGLGGAAKDLEIGRQAAETHKEKIADLVSTQLADAQVLLLALSLGGGSGAGSCETLVDILTATGKPVAVITVLPMDTEDTQTKYNALQTLSKLSKFSQSKKICNLIVVDNAKIESIFSNVSQMDFFGLANKAIIEPIDAFNTLSCMPSSVKGLDSLEWAKIFTDGGGMSIFGQLDVENFTEETAIAEAVISNLNSNLLAQGFDLKESKYVGIIVEANKEVWKSIPASSINYAMAMVNDQCGNPTGVFKGIYTTNLDKNVVRIYSFFSGLGLPVSRTEQLKTEAKELMRTSKEKDDKRNLSLNLDTGKNDVVSEAQKIKEKISAKSSAFGKLTNNVIDRRKQ